MKMRQRVRSSGGGFTLIELLVVVLIIGILAAIAIPQYFKVVERARVGEAHTFLSQIKQAEERYLARQSIYTANPGNLDIIFPAGCTGAANQPCGMTHYVINPGMTATACGGGSPGWQLTLQRCDGPGSPVGCSPNSANAPTYYQVAGAGYTINYDACTGQITYPGCANCTNDFPK